RTARSCSSVTWRLRPFCHPDASEAQRKELDRCVAAQLLAGVPLVQDATGHRRMAARWSKDLEGKSGKRKLHRGGAAATLFFATAALSLGALALAADAGLLVESPLLHFFEYALFRKLALEHAHCLVERTVYTNLHTPPKRTK